MNQRGEIDMARTVAVCITVVVVVFIAALEFENWLAVTHP